MDAFKQLDDIEVANIESDVAQPLSLIDEIKQEMEAKDALIAKYEREREEILKFIRGRNAQR